MNISKEWKTTIVLSVVAVFIAVALVDYSFRKHSETELVEHAVKMVKYAGHSCENVTEKIFDGEKWQITCDNVVYSYEPKRANLDEDYVLKVSSTNL